MITMALIVESVGSSMFVGQNRSHNNKGTQTTCFRNCRPYLVACCKPAGVLVLRSLAVPCNHLSSVVLYHYVLRCVPAIRRHCRQISQISPKEFPGISLSPNTLELGFHTRPWLPAFLNMEQDIAFPFLLVSSEIYSLSFLD